MVTPGWDPSLEAIAPLEYVGGTLAFLLGLGANFAVPIGAAAWLCLRGRRLDREADEAAVLEHGADAPLSEGKTIVRGVIEVEGGPAVCVTVHQDGRERTYKGKWQTGWKETRREAAVRPFVLVTADGTRLRCEPDERTHLVDDLDKTERLSLRTRVRRAELSNGERAIVRGAVVWSLGAGPSPGGYRGAPRELVMKPGPQGMAISTHGLVAPLREAARLQKTWAKVLLVMSLLAQLHLVRFYVSAVRGRVEPGTITETRSRRVKTKNGSKTVRSVDVRLASGRSFVEDIETKDAAHLGRGRVVPVRVAPLSTTIGAHPSENLWFFLFPSFLLGGVGAIAVAFIVGSKPWYARAVEESRSGRLADDCPSALRSR